jgi:bifunctional ADP-heptose synthase (sugar kinase/adenylyltransferase)
MGKPAHGTFLFARSYLVKGSDYVAPEITGADFVTSRGGQVVTLPLASEVSTTQILAKASPR